MTRWAVGVEYDGSSYCGWQYQHGQPSIAAELQMALGAIANHPVNLICGGRTDAGVHASGQVVHFESDSPRNARAWVFGANTQLSSKISLNWAQPVPDFFHARFSALRRYYRYTIFNRNARCALTAQSTAWVQAPLNIVSMQAGATMLCGEHDFSAFRAAACQSRSAVRRIDLLQVTRVGELIHIDISANAFLHHMVRNIAGLLISIGRAERSTVDLTNILTSRDRQLNAPTAPPEGLCLRAIEYPAPFGLPAPL
ncbi:MAG: tRNA pseudouridine(38-40) synthase TruA [Gammaproteobacteria bacterium]|nr:tRNA pseudouridine(38-40) synthase TruA [Gammaproteobacteria bacterium]